MKMSRDWSWKFAVVLALALVGCKRTRSYDQSAYWDANTSFTNGMRGTPGMGVNASPSSSSSSSYDTSVNGATTSDGGVPRAKAKAKKAAGTGTGTGTGTGSRGD